MTFGSVIQSVRNYWRRPVLREPALRDGPVLSPREHQSDVAARESREPRIIDGAEGCIRLAVGKEDQRTRQVYLYLHGLSACRQETAPVTETLSARADAHAVYARVAGHGMGDQAMGEVDGAAWLESVWSYWQRARQLGEHVVIVATSTGAAYATWLLARPGVQEQVAALLLMAPNYGVRDRRSGVLTWPGVENWLPKIMSPQKDWRKRDPRQKKYWSVNYGNRALIQMQLVLKVARSLPVEQFRTPLMVQCAPTDPVISPAAARRVFRRWGGQPKLWRWVDVPPGESAHVFVGDIMAPHRNDDVIDAFYRFLRELPPTDTEETTL